jgi:hypothetical protein
MYETLPFFSGRSTLEGVYNQASVMTHPVYYLASELFASSPNPFKDRAYSKFDPETALERLRLFGVGQIVSVSPELEAALDLRPDFEREARIPPYTLFRLRDPGPGYVEPLAFAPVRAPLEGWQDTAYRWMTRKPPNQALLVFTPDDDDERFQVELPNPWAPPPEVPLPDGVEIEATVEAEEIRIRTSRPGHPLLVKVSYHPRWRAEGADGPYLASPGLMIIVPRRTEVRLHYAGRAWPDALGWALGFGTLLLAIVSRARRRRGGPPGLEPEDPPGGGGARWLKGVPLAIVVVVAAARFLPAAVPPGDAKDLYERASRAYAEKRFDDAAEYARHGVALLSPDEPRRSELLWVGGESLLRAGHPREALFSFSEIVERAPTSLHRAQALFSGALARETLGDLEGAALWRQELVQQYPGNPWAERLSLDER